MALAPSVRYPGQIATDSSYPLGKAKDVAVDGDGTGTPWEKDLANDIFGLQQGLLVESHMVPSFVPDTALVSDYVKAVHAIAAQNVQANAIANHVKRTPAGGFSAQFEAIAWSGSRWIAVGQAGAIQRSDDGETWTQCTADASYTGTFLGVYADSSVCIAVGWSGEIQTSTDNGVTWTRRNSTGDDLYDVKRQGLASVFVAVGIAGTIRTSANLGATWTLRTPDAGYTGSFNALCVQNTRFIAVGSGGEIQVSDDGITWTHKTAGGAFNLTFWGVAAQVSGGLVAAKIIAVGAAFGGHAMIQTSSDGGDTWVVQTPADAYGGLFADVLWTGQIWLAISGDDDGVLQYSPNGTRWTSIGRPSTTHFNAGGLGDSTVMLVGGFGKIRQSAVLLS